uniref:Uncharacterized protein n=1 Tax=Podoviridae sp. ct8Lf7 TaxID=2827723 RepID=A0A8S5S0Y3_9CAUD|nr:MAG TPA: hypothetical protein [Podoviridae sp. ct8Lf7]
MLNSDVTPLALVQLIPPSETNNSYKLSIVCNPSAYSVKCSDYSLK